MLEQIKSSADLCNLDSEQLKELADEIRDFLIQHVSKTGGHLAANLGVVELTLALHLTFDVEKDRIVWDVGHQAYTHKILTGRKDQFDTLRQLGGLSGFPKTSENNADSFNTGHSSTSISAALGFAVANELKGGSDHAVAVIGDGALTGGMAFEALNHAGSMHAPLIVVLNDNGMSISKNVGGLSNRLRKIRNTSHYFKLKSDVKSVLDHIPVVGKPLKQKITRWKKRIKKLILQNMIFEDLGFTYLGPVDGHNLDNLMVILNHAKRLQEPVIVHVLTKKGKGYPPAEQNPGLFHGIGSFDYATGLPADATSKQTWSEYFGQRLCEMAERNTNLVGVTAAMPLGTGLEHFSRRFPERFFDVGIAEQHAVTFSAALARAGMIPCFAVYSTFLQRAYDQILHDVALQKLHVVFFIDRCGPVGSDGETHQGVFDISYLSHIPEMTILSPSNSMDFDWMMHYAVFECQGPIALRYPRGDLICPFWKPQGGSPPCAQMIRDGKDVLIAAVGTTIVDALEAAAMLEEKGISTAVLDIRCVKPLDVSAIQKNSIGKKAVAVLEDNVKRGGVGEHVASLLGREIIHLAYPDEAIVQGKISELKKVYGLDANGIAGTIEKHLAFFKLEN